MLKRVVIYPYKMGSVSSKDLATAVGAIRVFPDRNYKPKPKDLIVVWGAGTIPDWLVNTNNLLNKPDRVKLAIDKKACFAHLLAKGVSVPMVTVDREVANKWVNDGKTVIARATLTGSGGRGITIHQGGEVLPKALLYSIHVRHKSEYRVHVFNGEVIDVAEKRKKNGAEEQDGWNPLIRNYDKGWVFCHDDVECPDVVKEECIKAVKALSLDFGAVDVGYRVKEKQPYIFEINTAPGIEGKTLQHYADKIKELANG